MRRAVWARVLAAAAVVVAMFLVTWTAPEEAHAETWCGYAELGHDSTTTTVTFLSFCDDWTCEGSSIGPWPGGAFGTSWEVFICTFSP